MSRCSPPPPLPRLGRATRPNCPVNSAYAASKHHSAAAASRHHVGRQLRPSAGAEGQHDKRAATAGHCSCRGAVDSVGVSVPAFRQLQHVPDDQRHAADEQAVWHWRNHLACACAGACIPEPICADDQRQHPARAGPQLQARLHQRKHPTRRWRCQQACRQARNTAGSLASRQPPSATCKAVKACSEAGLVSSTSSSTQTAGCKASCHARCKAICKEASCADNGQLQLHLWRREPVWLGCALFAAGELRRRLGVLSQEPVPVAVLGKVAPNYSPASRLPPSHVPEVNPIDCIMDPGQLTQSASK